MDSNSKSFTKLEKFDDLTKSANYELLHELNKIDAILSSNNVFSSLQIIPIKKSFEDLSKRSRSSSIEDQHNNILNHVELITLDLSTATTTTTAVSSHAGMDDTQEGSTKLNVLSNSVTFSGESIPLDQASYPKIKDSNKVTHKFMTPQLNQKIFPSINPSIKVHNLNDSTKTNKNSASSTSQRSTNLQNNYSQKIRSSQLLSRGTSVIKTPELNLSKFQTHRLLSTHTTKKQLKLSSALPAIKDHEMNSAIPSYAWEEKSKPNLIAIDEKEILNEVPGSPNSYASNRSSASSLSAQLSCAVIQQESDSPQSSSSSHIVKVKTSKIMETETLFISKNKLVTHTAKESNTQFHASFDKTNINTNEVSVQSPLEEVPVFPKQHHGLGLHPQNMVGFGFAGNSFDNEDASCENLSVMEKTFLRYVSLSNVGSAKICLTNGVDVHVKNTFERDAMQIAARNGSLEMLQMLKDEGGDIYSRGPKGDTLFYLAAANGHVGIMKWLHSVGVVTGAVDIYRQSAVHVAARRGELQVIEYLNRELNMDFLRMDFDGRTPLECMPRRSVVDIEPCRKFIINLYQTLRIME